MSEVPISPQDIAEAEDIDFQEIKECWQTYKLQDGTTLKVRLILVGVKRLKKYAPDGNPIYVVNPTNVVRACDIPKELKQKPKESNMKVT